MRFTWMVVLVFIGGCSAEQNFGETAPSQVEAGGEGRAEIFPSDGVTMGPFDIGFSEVGGFRIDSVGEFPLKIISMSLIDAGDNAGEAVFAELRPADSADVVPFEIPTGDGAEFMLTATMSEVGTASGTIEIYTNDSTVNDSGPGYIRIPLTATAVDPNAEGTDEDTGGSDDSDSDTGGDSGSDTDADESDTGPAETDAPEPGDEDTGAE